MMMIGQEQETSVSPELRNQLARMIRNTQWSYTIYWTVSSSDAGLIEWGEGYYNGETRTEKLTKLQDIDTHNWGLQRSEQLRNLYKSLLDGKAEQGKKRNSATSSMEDLSDLEWYYLVCMSFSFKFGQSLPGRAYSTRQHVWLCGAQSADSSMFTRSLLAKSASVQTVICLPYLRGVIELGSTDLITEDLKFIQRIVKASGVLTEPVCSWLSSSAPYSTDHENHRGHTSNGDDDIIISSTLPNIYFTSRGQMVFNQEIEDVINKRTSEDPTISSTNNCAFMLGSSTSPTQDSQQRQDNFLCEAFDSRDYIENLNYGTHFSVTPKSMDQIIDSDFSHWRNELPVDNVPFYALDEERENEQFMILGSMVPSIAKTDKRSILSIESSDEVEVRLDELEFGMDLDMLDHTSEIYNRDAIITNPSMNKIDSEMNETQTNVDHDDIQTDISLLLNIEVGFVNGEIVVEMNCPWREYLLLDIIKVMNNLNLDVHAVQSSILGRVLFLSLKSKVRGADFVTGTMIKQALRRTIWLPAGAEQ